MNENTRQKSLLRRYLDDRSARRMDRKVSAYTLSLAQYDWYGCYDPSESRVYPDNAT